MEILTAIFKFIFFWGIVLFIMRIGYNDAIHSKGPKVPSEFKRTNLKPKRFNKKKI